MDKTEKAAVASKLFIDEIVDYEVYRRLSLVEKESGLKILLGRLERMEKAHMNLWAEIAGIRDPSAQNVPIIAMLRIYAFLFVRKIMGVAFLTMLLSRNEKRMLEKYNNAIKSMTLTERERKQINTIINDERYNEENLKERIRKYRGQLGHIRSIVFGLNDGVVELLAAVSGIAVIATSSLVVVVSGIIIGTAGTLSMAAGAYLSAKSHTLVEDENTEDKDYSSPVSEAAYTGVYYFIGVVVSIVPFIFGLNGYPGIIAAIILASITLGTASVVIAVVSGTSISKRVVEMLAISLSVVMVTIILGTIARTYFGVTI